MWAYAVSFCLLLTTNQSVKQKPNYGLVFYYGEQCEIEKSECNTTRSLRNLGNGFVSYSANVTLPNGMTRGTMKMQFFKSGDSTFAHSELTIRYNVDICKFINDPRQFSSLVRNVCPLVTKCPVPKGEYQFTNIIIDPHLTIKSIGSVLDDYYTYVKLIARIFGDNKKLLLCLDARWYRMLLRS